MPYLSFFQTHGQDEPVKKLALSVRGYLVRGIRILKRALPTRSWKHAVRRFFYVAPGQSFCRNFFKAPIRAWKRYRERITNDPWPASQPLVTVVVPANDTNHLLATTLAGILSSSWRDLEILVLDSEASQFESLDLTRVVWLTPGTWTAIFSAIRGKYLFYLPAGDQIAPHYIESAVYLMETVGVDLIVPDASMAEGGEATAALRKFDREKMGATAAAMMRRSFLTDHALEKSIIASAPGPEFWWDLARRGARLIHLSEPGHLLGSEGPNFAGNIPFGKVQQFSNAVTSEKARQRQLQRPQVRNRFVNLDRQARPRHGRELNLLLCVPYFDNYGSAVFLSNLFCYLTRLGVAVTVVATNPETDPYCTEGVARFRSFSPDCFYLATSLPEGNKEDFLSYLVRSRKIDLLMMVSSQLTYESLPKLRRANPRLRVIDHLYNVEDHIPTNRKFSPYIDFNIVANDDVRAVLMQRGESAERIRVIACGIDTDRFEPQRFEHPATRDAQLTFGYLGRLSEEKRPLDIVEMARRFPRYRFLIAGEGRLRSELEEAVRRFQLGDRVQLLGYHPVLVDFFNRIDALIIPSRLEGLPNVLLEAMVLRKPTIAARVGMIPQVIEDGVNGFLYPSGDLESLAQKIELAAELTPENWLALGQKARAKVLQDHGIAGCAERYLATFRQVLGRQVTSV